MRTRRPSRLTGTSRSDIAWNMRPKTPNRKRKPRPTSPRRQRRRLAHLRASAAELDAHTHCRPCRKRGDDVTIHRFVVDDEPTYTRADAVWIAHGNSIGGAAE